MLGCSGSSFVGNCVPLSNLAGAAGAFLRKQVPERDYDIIKTALQQRLIRVRTPSYSVRPRGLLPKTNRFPALRGQKLSTAATSEGQGSLAMEGRSQGPVLKVCCVRNA